MKIILQTLALVALPLTHVFAQTTVPQDIVPFSTLPACALKCGKLFDVQGGCSPPVTTSPDKSCFCNDARLSPFFQSTTMGVCNDACPDDPSGLLNIQKWVVSFCADVKASTPTTTSASDATATGTAATTGTATSAPGSGTTITTPVKKQTWIETHAKWVVMAVILVIAFVGGWIAAAFFRRRYLRKRELNYEMRAPAQPWVTGDGRASAQAGPYGQSVYGPGVVDKEASMMSSALPSKKEKKKWVVKERT